jgi:ATP-dependent exoDNAse (exonuclease V) alpha subunit
LHDAQAAQTYDYTRKSGVLHSEILAPENAPSWALDREALWNRVEAKENTSTRPRDAQLARELLLTLPRELSLEQQVTLLRGYLQEQYVAKGMVADVAVHYEKASDGKMNPHAHVMLTMRELDAADPTGFGKKNREWNPQFSKGSWIKDKDKIIGSRTLWADYVNRALEEAGSNARVDHRSLADRGLRQQPEPKLGKARYADNAESKARRALAERTRWINRELRYLDHGRYVDPLQEIINAEYEAQAYYRANPPLPSHDISSPYQGSLAPGSGPEHDV